MFPLNFKDRPAILCEAGCFTYNELQYVSESIAMHADARSVVLVIANNSLDCLSGYIGFLNKGLVPLMLNETVGNDALCEIISRYCPEYFWAPVLYPICIQRKYRLLTTYGQYGLFASGSGSQGVLHEDLALLLSTSGSTGSRKFVRLSKNNILSNAQSIIEYLSIGEDERAITTLPFSYSYGLSIVHSHLLAGASTIFTEKTLFDRDFWQLFKEYGATSFGGVPYTYSILKQLHFSRMELPSLRYITQAGGRLSAELHREFVGICAGKDIDFVVMYGQTEATARISYLPAELSSSKIGSIGYAIPGGTMELEDDDGKKITEPGLAGELVYRGSNVSLGYASCREDLALGDERYGVLRTGDIARCDQDGVYCIVGRKKRFLKIFGNRVNLDELENILSKEGVNAAVTGEDDACCVFLETSEPDAVGRELKQKISVLLGEKTRLNRNSFKVQVVSELPRNESGKILYEQLKEWCI